MGELHTIYENLISGKNISPNLILDDPEYPIGREQYIKNIITQMGPLLIGKNTPGIILKGTNGSGKSVTLKYIIKEFKKFCKEKEIQSNIILWRAGVNNYLSSFAIYKDIAKSLGVSCNNFTDFLKYLKQNTKFSLLIIDELQDLKPEVINAVIRDLTRLETSEDLSDLQSGFSFILATNFFNENKLTMNTRSSINNANIIIFTRYTKTQLLNIIKEKTKMKGLYYNNFLAQEIVNYTEQEGDARLTLQCYAQLMGYPNITKQSIKKFIIENKKNEIDVQLSSFPTYIHRTFEYCVKLTLNNQLVTSETIYQKNLLDNPSSSFSIFAISKAISNLEKIGLINTEHRKIKGRSRSIFIQPEQLEIYKKIFFPDEVDNE